MKLNSVSNICEKINENAAYAFLFTPGYINWNDKADRFIEKFADDHGLRVTTVAPGTWTFTHQKYGLLNDGLIELDRENSTPMFKMQDVSNAKVTSHSPDLSQDMEAVNNQLKDAKIEYVSKLKAVISITKEAIDELSANLTDNSNSTQTMPDIDSELENLQKRYHLAIDRLREIQGSTEDNYEALKARVEMSLITLKHSIDETASKFKLNS